LALDQGQCYIRQSTLAMLKWRRASSRRSTHPPPDGCEPDTRPTGAEDQQFTKMGVASLADPAEPLFAVEYSLGTKPIPAAKWRPEAK